MASEFVSLAVITVVAAAVPLIARLIPRQIIPETVLLILFGAILGPHMLGVIQSGSEAVSILKELGCSFLFLLAGFEIDPRSITGKDGLHGLATWGVTFVIGILTASLAPAIASGTEGMLATALLFTTTALGALMPMLKDNNLTGTRVGDLIISYGTWGELATIFAVAILLSARSTWKTALILGLFVLLCVWLARLGSRAVKGGHAIYRFLESKSDTNSQTTVRITIMLLVILVTFSAVFDLDIVLGAFAAGFVLRYIIPEGDHSLEMKLDGIGSGFFIPLFFIASGCGIDLRAVAKMPLLMLLFIAGLVLVRTIPIVVSLTLRPDTRKEISLHGRFSCAFYCTAALPLVVAITGIATDHGLMEEDVASVLVAAGAVTVFLMPFLGKLVYTVTDSDPAGALAQISHDPGHFREILHQHMELARQQASQYRDAAGAAIRSSLDTIEDPQERKEAAEMTQRHLQEQQELLHRHLAQTRRLRKRQYAEFSAFYAAHHNGNPPDEQALEEIEKTIAREAEKQMKQED